MATYIISTEILFEVEARNKEEAIIKAWTVLDLDLPKQFDTDTTELNIWEVE